MKNPYDSYLMRKAKPEFLGFYCGRPVYEGDNVNLKRLQQMPLRAATMVSLVDDDGLSEKVQEANDLIGKYEAQKSVNALSNSMIVTGGHIDDDLKIKVALVLMFVFFVLLAAL